MTPDDIGARAVSLLGDGASAETTFGQVTIDVPAERWVDAATATRDDEQLGCDFFDWLSAYDAEDAGIAVVTHVWSTGRHHHLLLRTRVARDGGRLASLTGVWAGANWHERETYEMFGVVFDGHPNLAPLLLPEGFEGNPLRKEFVLASRVAKAWPGAKEPGESDHDTGSPGRRRMLPPGVPDPAVWGPPAADAARGDRA
jgi:NADH-quinone oxidoreductase subunit C